MGEGNGMENSKERQREETNNLPNFFGKILVNYFLAKFYHMNRANWPIFYAHMRHVFLHCSLNALANGSTVQKRCICAQFARSFEHAVGPPFIAKIMELGD